MDKVVHKKDTPYDHVCDFVEAQMVSEVDGKYPCCSDNWDEVTCPDCLASLGA